MEIWKAVKDYEGSYEVSSFGNVRSLDRFVDRGFKKIPVKGRLMTKRLTEKGYYKVDLSKVKNGKKSHKGFFVHRLVASVFVSNFNGKPHVNHKDGIKINNYPNNLEWVTPSENTIHAYENGLLTRARGEDSPNAKLTNKQAQEIRDDFRFGIDLKKDFAKKYNINRCTIRKILTNKSYV